MGAWKHTRSPKICFTFSDETSNISKCNTNNTGEGSLHTETSILQWRSSGDVPKIVSTVYGK